MGLIGHSGGLACLANSLLLFDGLQAQLILIRKNRVDPTDLNEFYVSNGLAKTVVLFSIALP